MMRDGSAAQAASRVRAVMKLYGGLTVEALQSAAGALGDAFEPRPDKNRTNESA